MTASTCSVWFPSPALCAFPALLHLLIRHSSERDQKACHHCAQQAVLRSDTNLASLQQTPDLQPACFSIGACLCCFTLRVSLCVYTPTCVQRIQLQMQDSPPACFSMGLLLCLIMPCIVRVVRVAVFEQLLSHCVCTLSPLLPHHAMYCCV